MSIVPMSDNYTALIDLIEVERGRYANTPYYKPSKRQRATFNRNYEFFSNKKGLDYKSQTSRYRAQSTQYSINTLYQESEQDLFILCLLVASPTQLAALRKGWVTNINTWWESVVKPDQLSVVAGELCNEYHLVSDKGARPNTSLSPEATPSIEYLGSAAESAKKLDKDAEIDDSIRRPLSSNSSEPLTGDKFQKLPKRN